MSRRLILVRHGQIQTEYLGRLIGATDAALDPVGEAQARALASRVAHWQPDVCYCSPMRRCQQTARLMVPELPLRFDEQLREVDFGRWERRTFEEAAREDPACMAHWSAFAPEFAFPEGESLASFLHRVKSSIERLANDEAERVLAVTHGGVIRLALCHLLGLESRKYLAFNIGYAALAVVDLFDGGGVLVALEPAADSLA